MEVYITLNLIYIAVFFEGTRRLNTVTQKKQTLAYKSRRLVSVFQQTLSLSVKLLYAPHCFIYLVGNRLKLFHIVMTEKYYVAVYYSHCYFRMMEHFYDPDYGNCYTIPAKNRNGRKLESREADFWQEANGTRLW